MIKGNRFDYVKYDEESTRKQCAFKDSFMSLAARVEGELPIGRAQSLALTSLEEAYMWIGKAIRDEQSERNNSTELLESRGNQ